MALLADFAPLLLAMVALTAGSAFFSCAEAALFSLQPDDRRALAKGNAAQRTAVDLLARPERLLTAVLFFNLMINVAYFAISSAISIQLQRSERTAEAATLSIASLILLIVFAEMTPKTLGVQHPRFFAGLLSLPLAAVVRAGDAFIPALSWLNRFAQRILLPGFRREPYLELQDLEKALSIRGNERQLADAERSALQNIVSLSELQADELMQPRRLYACYRPPVHLADLGPEIGKTGYVLVSEADSDEVAAAIPLKLLPTAPKTHLESHAQPVLYMPWCATGAAVLEELHRRQREVAAIVNEFGETVGIVTLEDLLATIFEQSSSRSARLLATASISPRGEGLWEVTGMTSLRRLERHFNVDLSTTHHATVAGVLHEQLHRLPEPGDEVVWCGLAFRVLSISDDGQLRVELALAPGGGLAG